MSEIDGLRGAGILEMLNEGKGTHYRKTTVNPNMPQMKKADQFNSTRTQNLFTQN